METGSGVAKNGDTASWGSLGLLDAQKLNETDLTTPVSVTGQINGPIRDVLNALSDAWKGKWSDALAELSQAPGALARSITANPAGTADMQARFGGYDPGTPVQYARLQAEQQAFTTYRNTTVAADTNRYLAAYAIAVPTSGVLFAFAPSASAMMTSTLGGVGLGQGAATFTSMPLSAAGSPPCKTLGFKVLRS